MRRTFVQEARSLLNIRRNHSISGRIRSLAHRTSEIAPGFAASLLVSAAGSGAADIIGATLTAAQGLHDAVSPVSGVPCAILIGIGINNCLNVPATLKPGLSFSSTTVLRTGIVLVGMKLSLLDLVHVGAVGIPVVAASMSAGFIFIPWAAERAGLSRKLGSLLAAGTSVCGVTAITAVSPAIKAEPKDTAVAIANVVCFGTLGMLGYPYLSHALFSEPGHVGLFLGVAVHDTSQVLGSAASYAQLYDTEEVLKVAAVTKLTRNLMLAGVIPGLAWQYRSKGTDDSAVEEESRKEGPVHAEVRPAPALESFSGLASFQKYVPGFVVAFVAASGVRTIGEATLASSGLAYGLLDGATFHTAVTTLSSTGSSAALGAAMAAVGLSTSSAAIRGAGLMPFAVGLSGSLVVGGTGMGTIRLLEYSGLLLP